METAPGYHFPASKNHPLAKGKISDGKYGIGRGYVAHILHHNAKESLMNMIRRKLQHSFTLGQCLAWLVLVLVLLTLGAHFYRAGEYGVAACAAGAILFLCLQSAWKQYAVALFLLWGAAEWVHSSYSLAAMRMHMGLPWLRAALILMAVALLTALAGVYALQRARRLTDGNASQEAFAKDGAATLPGNTSPSPFFQGAVFIVTFMLLFYLRQGAPISFLLLERFFPMLGSVQIFFAAWYAAFVAGLLASPGKSRKTRRWIWLAFCCVFFAQFFLGLAGLQSALLTGKLHVPIPGFIIFAPIFRESFSVMPIIVLVATLLTGSAWCSHLCYFGPMDAMAAGGKGAAARPQGMQKLLRYGRLSVLCIGVLATLALRAAGITTGTAVGIAVAFGLVSLLLMAALSARYRFMAHCTMFCPLGIAVDLLGRLSPWRIRVDRSGCDNCGACEKVCKYAAITPESRERGTTDLRCSLCRDCLGVCKKNALYLHCPGLSRARAAAVFTGLVAVLHALFFSVAMV